MPVAYSTDLRTRVIDTWNAKEGTQAQLAERFKVSESFVKQVQRWIEQKPDILLKELCENLATHQGIQVSQPTMCRAVYRSLS